MSHGDRLPV